MSKKLNIVILFLLLAIVGILSYMVFGKKHVESVSLIPREINIYIGENYHINLMVSPEDATDKSVIWKSNNEMIAVVDSNGTVRGIGEGQTEIVATAVDNDKNDLCRVTVNVREVEKIELANKVLVFQKGESKKLNATIYPANATYQALTYQSSNQNVATVDNEGNVVAINEGVASISVKDTRGKVEEICKIVVGIPLEKIEISEINTTVVLGKTKSLNAILTPANAITTNVKWTSSDENIATVDNNGVVTGKALGEVTITLISVDMDMTATCKVIVKKEPVPVSNISLNKTNARLKIGTTVTLTAKVTPSNADENEVTWSSGDTSIATVSSNGVVTAKKSGKVNITAKAGNKSTTCTIVVNYSPKKPGSYSDSYDSLTLKYYIQKNNGYYLTYIWMEDPYEQIKKIEATVAKYGRVYTDDELDKSGRSPLRMNIGEMLNSYISSGKIQASKAVLAYNGSGFYVSGTWNPPSAYYHNRSTSWFEMNDGKITRNRRDGSNGPSVMKVVGVDANGDFRVFGSAESSSERDKIVNNILASKVKNTWGFNPQLVTNGVATSWLMVDDYRQAICQIDSNNYVMYTSTSHSGSYGKISYLFEQLHCKTGFNFDGGGSTQFFIKKAGSRSITKMQCSDGSSRTVCRSTVEGIYFTEK